MHVIDVWLATATDPQIVEYAEAYDLVIVTVDTDFPMLIALRRYVARPVTGPQAGMAGVPLVKRPESFGSDASGGLWARRFDWWGMTGRWHGWDSTRRQTWLLLVPEQEA